MRGTGVAGRYAQAGKDVSNPTAGGTGEASKVWQSLKQAFKALEGDFARLDINGDTFISRAEIAQGVPVTKTGKEKMDILTRLSYAWSQVDIDGNGTANEFDEPVATGGEDDDGRVLTGETNQEFNLYIEPASDD